MRSPPLQYVFAEDSTGSPSYLHEFIIACRFAVCEAAFGTIKAQTLSNQIGVVLVFIIMRWIRPGEVAFRVTHPEIKVSAAHLVIMIRLSRLEMLKHLPSNEPK